MKYKVKRVCKECKNTDFFDLSKKEAAFELYEFSRFQKMPCSRCGSVQYESIGHTRPKLDKELLDIWGADLHLHLMQQDEELLLAEIEYLPMILQAIDESKYMRSKINILIEALCILLYDNTICDGEYSELEDKERQRIANVVRAELIKRKAQVIETRESIMDYIQEVVFPQIGIDNAKTSRQTV